MSSMIEQITPLILTYDEAPNIRRSLEQLGWAGDVVVVDSLSTDGTVEIASDFPNVRVFQRQFDTLDRQWNFALKETGISSEWVLALDADYILTAALAEELRGLHPGPEIGGYGANFVYCVDGRPLRASAYPPVTVLYRRARAFYRQDGHAQRVVVDGEVKKLRSPILHDDRKPLGRWLQSQGQYMRTEAEKLRGLGFRGLNWPDRVRKLRIAAPILILLYLLIVKRAFLDGRHGLLYTLQRTVAELILSMYLIENDIRRENGGRRAGVTGRKARAELLPDRKEQG